MNFNDYYNYLNEYNDINYLNNPNKMIEDLNYQTSIDVIDSKDGFKKGNMFNNLYDEYKDFKPKKLTANSEREDMLTQIQEYTFAIIDLDLYLDTNPNDKKALLLFSNYLNKKKEIVNLYEEKYGPLTLDSDVQTKNWQWNNSPWPWGVQK